jgi:hypothetical protein
MRTVVKQFQVDGRPFVYLIQQGTRCKIGFSRDVARRLHSFDTANAKPCQLLAVAPGGRQQERELHERFKRLRVSGEWFMNRAALLAHFVNLPDALVFLPGYLTAEPPPAERIGAHIVR